MRYHDLVLEAFAVPSAPDAGEYRLDFAVRVLSSPAGEMSLAEAVPFGFDWRADLQPTLNAIADRKLDRAGLIAFGTRLAALLLPAAPEGRIGVRELFEASLRGADQEQGLRLRLRLPPTLAWIPWEYLYIDDPAAPDGMLGFLALNPRIAVLRHEALPTTPPRVEPPAGTLKVAVGLAQAPATKPLELETERKWLTDVFAAGGATPAWMEQTTIGDILANMPHAHIFHFGGHGTFSTEDQGDAFLASNRLGLADKWVGAEQLSMNLRGTPPQVVTLGACFSARRGGPNVANLDESLSAALIRVGVPAVVGNQFTIDDGAAIAFSQGFYQALLGGLSIERAVVAGRLAIYNADPDGRDWGVPVLNMRAPHGELVPGADDEAVRAQARASAEQIIAQQVVQQAGDNSTITNSAVGVLNVRAEGARVTVGTTIENQTILDAGTDRTPQPPALPQHYLARPELEQKLRESLRGAPNHRPVVMVWGGDGSGKGSLVAHVARELMHEDLAAGGVLWASCTGQTAEAVLRALLKELGTRWYDESKLGVVARDDLWRALHDRAAGENGARSRRTLVVLDQPGSLELLSQLLPPNSTSNRLVVISDLWLPTRHLPVHASVRISQFTPDEAVEIMRRAINEQLAAPRLATGSRAAERLRNLTPYRNELLQIADAVDYLPGRLVDAAQRLVAEGVSPVQYRKQLVAELASREQADPVDTVRASLTSEECQIFAICSLFGLNEWDESLLAAVALRPLEQLREAIAVLLEQGLLTQGSEGRYQLENNRVLRQARGLFKEQAPFQQQATWQLFARTCFERVADTRRRIEEEPTLPSSDDPAHLPAFVYTVREQLTPLLPHLREALRWAGEESTAWRLLTRFSDLAYVGYIRHLVWDAGAVYIEVQMATLENVVLGAPREVPTGAFELMAVRENNKYDGRLGFRGAEGDLVGTNDSVDEDLHAILVKSAATRLELHMLFTATSMGGGVVRNADCVHLSWTGARAEGMLWRECRLAEARFVACVLSFSLWQDCDLTSAVFAGSNLRDALLRNVRLRGADLRNADLSYAVLEHVDLRGANLTGASLRGARLQNVQLVGATLDRVDWSGATHSGLVLDGNQADEIVAFMDDTADQRSEFRLAAQAPRDLPETAEVAAAILHLKDADFLDLRGLTLDGLTLDQPELGAWPRRLELSGSTLNQLLVRGADLGEWVLRGATLKVRVLEDVRAVQASMRAIVMPKVLIFGSDFSGADLYAATIDDEAALVECVLDGVNLYGAALNTVRLLGVSLRGASLPYAQLNAAQLYNVILDGADLSNAQLIYTELIGTVSLRDVNLSGALLNHVSLRGADLHGARLHGARLIGVDFKDAQLRDEQLTEAAALRGSTLPDGSHYHGHLRLAGDLEAARNELREQGVSVDDEAEWAGYVARPELLRAFYEQPFLERAASDDEEPWPSEAPAHGSASLWALERNYGRAPDIAARRRDAALTSARQLFAEVTASHSSGANAVQLLARAAELMAAAASLAEVWETAVPFARRLIASLRPEIIDAALNVVERSFEGGPRTRERTRGESMLNEIGRELKRGRAGDQAKLVDAVRRLAGLRADLCAALTATLADPQLGLPETHVLCCYAAARIEPASAPRGQRTSALELLVALAGDRPDAEAADRAERVLALRGIEAKLPGTLGLAAASLVGLALPAVEPIRTLIEEALTPPPAG